MNFLAQAGAEPIENHNRRTLIKGDHIIGVKQRFPVAWAAPKRSWLTEPMNLASSLPPPKPPLSRVKK